jgi:hypothetical protein
MNLGPPWRKGRASFFFIISPRSRVRRKWEAFAVCVP